MSTNIWRGCAYDEDRLFSMVSSEIQWAQTGTQEALSEHQERSFSL